MIPVIRVTTATLAVTLLSACGTTEEAAEPAEREINPDCSFFESVHENYWRGYRSLPASTTRDPLPPLQLPPEIVADFKRRGIWTEPDPSAPPPQPTVIYTQTRDREEKGVQFAHDSVVKAWPLVSDETLRYLMQEMAEAATGDDWRRNFTSASSYCGLPDLPNQAILDALSESGQQGQ